MNLISKIGPFLVVALVAVSVLSSPAYAKTPESDGPRILVLAASSLTGPIGEVAAGWEEETGAVVDVSFAGSSTLAAQIERGARADVFLSANREWIDYLSERGLLVDGTRRVFASNRLVWVVPAGRSDKPVGLDEIDQNPPKRLALGGAKVPAGMYARQALRDAGVWEGLAERVVSGQNVKRALQWVAMGEVDAGIVYKTDALASDDVSIAFEFSERLQPKILYEGAVPTGAEHSEAGQAFLDYLNGEAARSALIEAGFSEPPTGVSGTDSPAAVSLESQVEPASAIGLSLWVGLLCVIVGILPAVLLGWLLARREFFGKSVVATLLLAPIALPPVVTGFILLRLFGRAGYLGSLLDAVGLQVPFTTLGAAIAAFVVSFPLFLLTTRSAFGLVDRRFEEVSATLGSRPPRTFWRVTIPLALPGIAAGALLTFARAIGEFGATAVLAGNVADETRTIPLAIYTLLESPGGRAEIWWLVGVSLVLSLVGVVGFEWFNRRQRRRLEARS